jgi:DNA polymerase-3 subunit epsilon
VDWRPAARAVRLNSRITKEEAAAHDAFVGQLGDGAIWNKLA